MKVLLLDNVAKLGKVGEIVEVRDGYARNYLMPMGLSVFATKNQIQFHKERLEKARAKHDEEIEELTSLASGIEGVEFAVEKNQILHVHIAAGAAPGLVAD